MQDIFLSTIFVLTFIWIVWALIFYTLTFLNFTHLLIFCFTCVLHLFLLNFNLFLIQWKLISLSRASSFRRKCPNNKSFVYFILWTCISNIICWIFRFHYDGSKILHSHFLFHAFLHFSMILCSYNTLLSFLLF